MKRVAEPIVTTELCSYGCNQVALFLNGSKKYMCAERSNKCPAIRSRNSKGLKLAYELETRVSSSERYKSLSVEAKERMKSRKGKCFTAFTYGGKGQHKLNLIIERGHQCENCKLLEWQNQPITLELDHIDGDRQNNTKENLRLLCPNCHSLTPTWRRGNRRNQKCVQKYTDEQIIEAIKTSENINQVLVKLDLRYGSVSTIVKVMSQYQINFMGS